MSLTTGSNGSTLGQQTSANSNPIVIASDQSAIPATQSGVWTVSAVSGTVDSAPATQNITTQDLASANTTGANSQPFIIGTPTAGSAASFALSSFESAEILVSGIWTGTVAVEISMDSGTTWTTRGVKQSGVANISSSFTLNFQGGCNIVGMTNIRVRATAAMTGTATVKLIASINPGSVTVSNPGMLRDSTTQSILNTIKAASTAAIATDTSLVIAISPNSALPTGSNVIGALSANQSVNLTQMSGSALTLGQKVSASSVPIVIASDQSAIPVSQSGTWTVQQGNTPTAVANAWSVKLTDGTNTTAVKAASTAAAAADPSAVVALSPNSPLPAGTNTLGVISTKIALTSSSPTAATVGITSASAVASNANRKGLVLTNTSANKISFGIGTAAVLNSGITLFPGGTWVMDEFNFTTGAINAIASVASSNLAIQEFTT